MLGLKQETSKKYIKKVTGMARAAGCKSVNPCDGFTDAHAFFKYEWQRP
jgi:hypothetical protein